MCVAELNVSTQPCGHRWFHLLRPCSPSANLDNCKRKLGLAGWELKCDFCPYCSGWNISTSDYRLLGRLSKPRADSKNFQETPESTKEIGLEFINLLSKATDKRWVSLHILPTTIFSNIPGWYRAPSGHPLTAGFLTLLDPVRCLRSAFWQNC